MKEKVNAVLRQLQIVHYSFWVIAISLFALGMIAPQQLRYTAENEVLFRFYAESTDIMVTILCLPLSLKLFSWVLKKRIDNLPLLKALDSYRFWCIMRIILIAIPMILGFIIYIMIQSNTGVLCGLCAVTSSFFCVPSRERLLDEMNLTEGQTE